MISSLHDDHDCATFRFKEDEFSTIALGLRNIIFVEQNRKLTDGAFDWDTVIAILGRKGIGHVIKVPQRQSSKENINYFLQKMHTLQIEPRSAISAYMLVDNNQFPSRPILDLSKTVRAYCDEDAIIAMAVYEFENPMTLVMISPQVGKDH